MSGTYFYSIGIAFAGGVFLRSFFEWNTATSIFFVLIGIGCLTAWFVRGREHQSPLVLTALIFIAGALGMFRFQNAENHVSTLTPFEGEKMSFTVRVARELDERDTTTHLYVHQIENGVVGNELILVTANTFAVHLQDIHYGDDIVVEGKVKKPESFVTDTGKEFPYEGFLRARGVLYTIPFAQVTLLEHRDTFLGMLYKGKHRFLQALERAIPEPASGLGAGMLLGVNSALGKQLDAVFRETGIIHIVVLSGYNIMVVVEALLSILTFFCFPRTRMVIGSISIILFAFLVGFSATVMRASLMAILLLIARTSGRTYAVLRALVLAGVLMLLWNPYLLVYDPGFQLSFLATLGLILFSPHVEKKLLFVPPFLGVRGFVTATLSTQIAVLPLLLFHTGMISFVSVLTNMLVLPMVPWAMALTFLTGIAGLFSETAGVVVGFVAYGSLQYIIKIAEACASIPYGSMLFGHFSFLALVCAYAVIVWVYIVYERRTRVGVVSAVEEVKNDYEGWVIEEEKDGPEEVRGTPSGSSTPLPFR